MGFFEKIKAVSFNIAKLGKLSTWKTGGLIASLLAFPLILLGHFFYKVSPTLFYWLFFSFILFSFLIVYFSLSFLVDKDKNVILWDDVLGMATAFVFVPFQWKIMVLGFILFHIINYVRPLVLRESFEQKIDNLPAGLGILFGAVASGVICNLFLQLVVWVIA